MADLSISVAGVQLNSGGVTSAGITVVTYGDTVTEMMPLYSDGTDNNDHKPADASASATAQVVGLALTPGADGEQGVIVSEGKIEPGATLSAGTTYYLSANAGGIAPYADLSSSDQLVIIGHALTTSVLLLDINVTGETKP